MAQSEGAATSPSAGGAGDSRDDGFVPVPKDEPLSPAPVRAPTAFITDPIRPRAVARPFKTTTPIPRLSTAPPSRVSQPSVKKVTSRFFSCATRFINAPIASFATLPSTQLAVHLIRSCNQELIHCQLCSKRKDYIQVFLLHVRYVEY